MRRMIEKTDLKNIQHDPTVFCHAFGFTFTGSRDNCAQNQVNR